jgi:hypothetical protein
VARRSDAKKDKILLKTTSDLHSVGHEGAFTPSASGVQGTDRVTESTYLKGDASSKAPIEENNVSPMQGMIQDGPSSTELSAPQAGRIAPETGSASQIPTVHEPKDAGREPASLSDEFASAPRKYIT